MRHTNYMAKKRLMQLTTKARWVWEETLRIHKTAPETRVASSLSAIEILVCLYYGGLLKFNASEPQKRNRDRLIISKGHGSIALYPILADLGFFSRKELLSVCKYGSFLGAIPDPSVPGYETCNGSLGHGLGVGCGIALALRLQKIDSKVVVLVGDGELHEGSVWEAIMFAAQHKLDNLLMIIDSNTKCMLNYSHKVLDIFPLEPKLRNFGWIARPARGHDISDLMAKLASLYTNKSGQPAALIANTIKGKGVSTLERDPICHVKSIPGNVIDSLLVQPYADNT